MKFSPCEIQKYSEMYWIKNSIKRDYNANQVSWNAHHAHFSIITLKILRI